MDTRPLENHAPGLTASRAESSVINNEKLAAKEKAVRDARNPSKKDIEAAVKMLEKASPFLNRSFRFRVHEPTKRMIVEVIDTDSNKVVKEIPSRELLRFVSRLHEMIGLLVDAQR